MEYAFVDYPYVGPAHMFPDGMHYEKSLCGLKLKYFREADDDCSRPCKNCVAILEKERAAQEHDFCAGVEGADGKALSPRGLREMLETLRDLTSPSLLTEAGLDEIAKARIHAREDILARYNLSDEPDPDGEIRQVAARQIETIKRNTARADDEPQYLSQCCGAQVLDEFDPTSDVKIGRCGKCQENAVFEVVEVEYEATTPEVTP